MEVQGYRLGFRPRNATLDTTVELSARERTYTLTDIRPPVTYIFTLAARSRAGYGEEARQEVEVPDQPPSGFPQVSDEVNATCCSLQLSWGPPDPAQANGVITEYTITYREVGGAKPPDATPAAATPAAPWQVTVPASQSSYTILGLNPSTVYEVQLRAHTSAGSGPFSPPLLSSTLAFETGRADLRLVALGA